MSAAMLSVELDTLLRWKLNVHLIFSILSADREIIRSYIHIESKRYKVFVANRIAAIPQHIEPAQWLHVNGTQNPADVGQEDAMQTICYLTSLVDLLLWECSRVNGQWQVILIWWFLMMTPKCAPVRRCLHGVVCHLLSHVLILWSCCVVIIPATTASKKLRAECFG